jgi:hypothetical protein
VPSLWKSCKHVLKLHAHDRTSGVAVKNFRRSTRLYNIAMRWNRGLDRDRDGIACEKRRAGSWPVAGHRPKVAA